VTCADELLRRSPKPTQLPLRIAFLNGKTMKHLSPLMPKSHHWEQRDVLVSFVIANVFLSTNWR
jgi:hypothetical protein